MGLRSILDGSKIDLRWIYDRSQMDLRSILDGSKIDLRWIYDRS